MVHRHVVASDERGRPVDVNRGNLALHEQRLDGSADVLQIEQPVRRKPLTKTRIREAEVFTSASFHYSSRTPKWNRVAQPRKLSGLYRPATRDRTGRNGCWQWKQPVERGSRAFPVPSGESPLGTGQWPVPPTGMAAAISEFRFPGNMTHVILPPAVAVAYLPRDHQCIINQYNLPGRLFCFEPFAQIVPCAHKTVEIC